MLYEKVKKSKKALTHSGAFHADDVFSSALLRKVNPKIKIERISKVPEDFNGIVFDIGGGKYDHHGKLEYRENGIPYASFGKLWRELGPYVVDDERMVENIDYNLVEKIDYNDNGGEFDSISSAISKFNPNWDEQDTKDQKFEEAIKFASIVLENEINREKAIGRARQTFKKEKEEKHNLLIMPRYLPASIWNNYCEENEIKFAMYPDNRTKGAWVLRSVDLDNDIFDKYTNTFPINWLGKNENEMKNIDDRVLFCHNSDFMIVCKSKEAAMNIAKEISDSKEIMAKMSYIGHCIDEKYYKENDKKENFEFNSFSSLDEIRDLKEINSEIDKELDLYAKEILKNEPYKEIKFNYLDSHEIEHTGEISVKEREEHQNIIQYKIDDKEVNKEDFYNNIDKKELMESIEKEVKNIDRESMKLVEKYEKIQGDESRDDVESFAMSFWNALDNAETIEEFEEIEHLAGARMKDINAKHASKGYKNIGKVVAKENNAFIKNIFEQVKEYSDRETGERDEKVISFDEADTLDYIDRGYISPSTIETMKADEIEERDDEEHDWDSEYSERSLF